MAELGSDETLVASGTDSIASVSIRGVLQTAKGQGAWPVVQRASGSSANRLMCFCSDFPRDLPFLRMRGHPNLIVQETRQTK